MFQTWKSPPFNSLVPFVARLMLSLAAVALCTHSVLAFSIQEWTEDSFEDFADGVLDAAGQNIYVSRQGKIRTIHRFDFNNDGWIDIIFNNAHDTYTYVPATLVSIDSGRAIEASEIPVEGSYQVVAEDLNRDGHLDLVFCPNEHHHPRRFLSIIYGGEDGWPVHRSNGMLPVRRARTVAIADLNHDRWPDIVTLNDEAWRHEQPPGNVIRIFWGGEKGFVLSRYQDEAVVGAVAMVSGDFDRNGASDVAVASSEEGVTVFWAKKSDEEPVPFEVSEISLPREGAKSINVGDFDLDQDLDLVIGTSQKKLYIIHGKSGKKWGDPEILVGLDASHIAVDDIDGDSFPDLVLSYFSHLAAIGGKIPRGDSDLEPYVRIAWGSRKGFSSSSSSRLEARFASASAVGDYDGDGHKDIAVAIYQAEERFETQSVIYFGAADRQFKKARRGVATAGAYSVTTLPADGDAPARLIFCNSIGGNAGERCNLYLYWGGSLGFSRERRLELPMRYNEEATGADLNEDGYPDIVAMDCLHGATDLTIDPMAGANIFWGRPEGFDTTGRSRTLLTEASAATSNTADLNRDGHLDLVLGLYRTDSHLIIYYGSANGFERENRVEVPSPGRSTFGPIADFDKDNWLDIAVTSPFEHCVRVFYGSPEGFDEQRSLVIDAPGAGSSEAADLNEDGWLDLLAACFHDPLTGSRDTGTLVFWGGPEGFRYWDAQLLPGMTPDSPLVADFDADGFLDVYSPHYQGEVQRELTPSYIFWGGSDGLQPRRRTELINNGAICGLAADFDRDGLLDLAAPNHTRDGNHNTLSKVFYNDGNRFRNPRVVELPTHGTHMMYVEDMGHIYDRSFQQTYESSVFSWNRNVRGGTLKYVADVPTGTKLIFEIRSAWSPDRLGACRWQTVEQGTFSLGGEARHLQYRAVFISDNGDRFPVLDKVTIQIHD